MFAPVGTSIMAMATLGSRQRTSAMLTSQKIHRVMDQCIEKTNANDLAETSIKLRRAVQEDAPSILELVHGLAKYEREPDAVMVTADTYLRDGFCGTWTTKNPNGHATPTPLFHCFLLEQESDNPTKKLPVGMALWYVGYSTWEGPFLYLEDLYVKEECRRNGGGKALMSTLVETTQQLDAKRLMWQVLDWNTPARDFYSLYMGAVTLNGTLTLRLERNGIDQFLAKEPALMDAVEKSGVYLGPLISQTMDRKIDVALHATNAILHRTSKGKLRLRRAVAGDIPKMLSLTQCLAAYVKEPDAVKATPDMYERDGFPFHFLIGDKSSHDEIGTDDTRRDLPLFFSIIIEEKEHDNAVSYTRGLANWYIGYSTWEGRYVYLEDLFVEPQLRGLGAGTAVMYALSAIAKSLDGARFVWQTKDWMSSARSFYTNVVGAKTLESWLTVQMDQNALKKFNDRRQEEKSLPN